MPERPIRGEWHDEDLQTGWREGVVEPLKQATLELVEVDDDVRQQLENNFWPTHLEIFKALTPDIQEQVMTRFEEIARESRDKLEKEAVTPKTLIRGFLKGAGIVLFDTHRARGLDVL